MARVRKSLEQAPHVLILTLMIALAAPLPATADSGCGTGGDALANAYARANPVSAYYFGNVESYVSTNRAHFQQGADAIRCATALSQAFLNGAVQVYDPNDLQRRADLNAQLGSMGISPGPQQPTLSQQLYGISMQLSRLARVLPAAAAGNYEPLYTPTNELEQMQLFAAQMFQIMMQDPTMAPVMEQIKPIAMEGAQMEYRIISRAAVALARSE